MRDFVFYYESNNKMLHPLPQSAGTRKREAPELGPKKAFENSAQIFTFFSNARQTERSTR